MPLSELAMCPWWWMQMACDPQRRSRVQEVLWAHNPSTATPRLQHRPAAWLSEKRERKKGESPVSVVSPQYVYPGIYWTTSAAISWLLHTSAALHTQEAGRGQHIHTYILPHHRPTLSSEIFNVTLEGKTLSYRNKSSKKGQAANSGLVMWRYFHQIFHFARIYGQL